MMKEYKTLKFSNNEKGQRQKIKELEELSRNGWRVVSETITQGKFRGKRACCLGLGFCLPCAFLAGSTEGSINVTLEREKEGE